ncbi:MAG: hypothetical protein JRJ56_03195 [Deltaproteobacteria bacterium]|jgi:hypothetical protein|nr:hypothetical protein [Deltaproteobacteria bacterium]
MIDFFLQNVQFCIIAEKPAGFNPSFATVRDGYCLLAAYLLCRGWLPGTQLFLARPAAAKTAAAQSHAHPLPAARSF